jgi:hypothetical protein
VSKDPARRDFKAATGVTRTWALRYHRPGDDVAASTIADGDWIIHDGHVWPVFAADASGDRIRLRLGRGRYSDPDFTVAATALVTPAEPAEWDDARMMVITSDAGDAAPTVLEVPTVLDGDPATACRITIDQDWLEPFQVELDHVSPGSTLALPFDLSGTFDGVPTWLLTGTVIVPRTALAPDVAAPVEEP